jgi:hypothetical protein
VVDEDRLARIAQDLVVRVRDDDPQANARWLASVTSGEERWALLFVLAAAVPDDMTWTELTEWTQYRVDGGVDTPHKVARRRAELEQALHPKRAAA